jgi:hypothetical protein
VGSRQRDRAAALREAHKRTANGTDGTNKSDRFWWRQGAYA